MEKMTDPTGASFCYNKATPIQPAAQVVQDDNGMKKRKKALEGLFRNVAIA